VSSSARGDADRLQSLFVVDCGSPCPHHGRFRGSSLARRTRPMRTPFPFLGVVLALVLLIASCRPTTNTSALSGGNALPKASEGTPTRDEILGYLDGKNLDLASTPAADRPRRNPSATTLLLKREGITALSIGRGASIDDGPWQTEMTFLYDTGDERYAVVGKVEHRLVENQRAFFGFTVDRVARQ